MRNTRKPDIIIMIRMLEMLIYLYVFDLDICDIHLLQNCDRSELHHIIIIYQNNHVLELCLGSNYIYEYVGERDGRIAGTCQPS